MRKSISVLLIVMVLGLAGYAGYVYFGGKPFVGVTKPKFVSTNTTGSENRSITIEAKVGETFSINLVSNPTTGYDWTVKTDNVTVMYQGYDPVGGGSLVGSPVDRIYKFKALKAGDGKITLLYERSKERGFKVSEVLKTLEVLVRVS